MDERFRLHRARGVAIFIATCKVKGFRKPTSSVQGLIAQAGQRSFQQ